MPVVLIAGERELVRLVEPEEEHLPLTVHQQRWTGGDRDEGDPRSFVLDAQRVAVAITGPRQLGVAYVEAVRADLDLVEEVHVLRGALGAGGFVHDDHVELRDVGAGREVLDQEDSLGHWPPCSGRSRSTLMTEPDSAASKASPSTVASSPATGGLVLALAEVDAVAAADAFQQG
ncbi:hypothetical protein HEP84_51840 [Streptomyces sp. RLB1-33]|nr:hypothetical protein [Streptomyces sp. RLB1-33]QIY76156.1 hypothetical protein HEP84_51840 [Streptomyces sp. RLB1-33]